MYKVGVKGTLRRTLTRVRVRPHCGWEGWDKGTVGKGVILSFAVIYGLMLH